MSDLSMSMPYPMRMIDAPNRLCHEVRSEPKEIQSVVRDLLSPMVLEVFRVVK